MEIVLNALRYLAYVLIFPGFLFCFLTGLLLAGIDRKLVARMQKRVGPPILQPFYDFFKLCGKKTIVPAAANKTVFLMAPLLGLASLVVLQLFIPVFQFQIKAFSEVADVIVILYLLLIPAVAIILGGASTGSPYAGIGLSREMVTVLACELPLVLVLLSVGRAVGLATGAKEGIVFSMTQIVSYQLQSGSLITKASLIPAAIAFLLVIPGETGNHPFDAAEAETEICEGMLAEYSGAPLGVFKLSHAVKMLTLTSLFVMLFCGGIGAGIAQLVAAIGLTGGAASAVTILLDVLVLFLLCVVVTAVGISLVHAVTARLKIEQIFKYYWTVVSALALLSLVLVWFGL